MLKAKQGIANIILFMSIIAAGLIICNNKAYADTEIKVYLNGTQLTYTDAQPQIINDRTMVPLSETAEHFNMTSNWDEDTATMYFNGNDRALIHTVYSNVIYVDGRLINYDFTSAIVNDRTLMPIRMIAEALDCDIEWAAEEKAVYITADNLSGNTDQSGQTQQVVQQTVEPVAEVYSASFSSSAISEGGTANMTVYGNFATTRVKVVDESGNTIAESSSYNTDESTNYFSLSFAVDTIGSHSLKVYGGTSSGYGLTYKTVNLTVESVSAAIEITDITLSDTEIDSGDEFTITVKTTADVAKVSIYDKNESRIANKTSPSSSTSSTYTWKFNITEEDYTGTVKYYIYAYDDDGNSIYETTSIYVNSSGSSSSSSSPSISSVDYDTYNEEGDRITVTVKTNTAVGYVSIIDPYSDEVAYLYSYSSKSGSYYYWELKFYFDEEGTYYVYAYDDDEDDYDRQKITLYFD